MDELEEDLGDKDNAFRDYIDETYNNYIMKLLDIEKDLKDYIKHMEQIRKECDQMCTARSLEDSLMIDTQQVEVKLAAVLNRMKPEYGDKEVKAPIFAGFMAFQTNMKKVRDPSPFFHSGFLYAHTRPLH